MSLGSFGFYLGGDAQNQQAAQNMLNVYSTTAASTNTAFLGNQMGGMANYGGLLNLANQQAMITNIAPMQAFMEQVAKPLKQKAKGILAKLRVEIDEWHGDVLDRLTA